MGLKVEANIMAQIVENVPPRDYLKEGEKIMKDALKDKGMSLERT